MFRVFDEAFCDKIYKFWRPLAVEISKRWRGFGGDHKKCLKQRKDPDIASLEVQNFSLVGNLYYQISLSIYGLFNGLVSWFKNNLLYQNILKVN